ncbi:MAG: hypothetical protein AAGD14_00640 [Planctomycetota bacterium]
MRQISLFLVLFSACAADQGRLYDGPARARSETALVEVNRYAQKRTFRWVITRVESNGRRTEQTFEIPPGPQRLEVAWRLYDATEKNDVGRFLVPAADRPRRIEEGVKVIEFEPRAGGFYRLHWTSRPDATIEGAPGDLELTLVDAGQRPLEPGETRTE